MNSYILGIDVGLTLIKADVYDLSGKLIVESVRKTPIVFAEECSEIDMNVLWTEVATVIKDTMHKKHIRSNDIIGIGISGHGNGLYCIDRKGNPIGNAITSMDHRGANILKAIDRDVKRKLLKKTLQQLWDGQPGILMKWLKEKKPNEYKNINVAFLCKDWITHCFTGEITTDYSDMSACGLFNNIKKTYDDSILSLLDIQEMHGKLPKVLKSYEIAGYVTKEVEKLTGLKKGTPVITGLFDVDACGIGAGLIEDNLYCSIAGTWNINMSITSRAVESVKILMCTIRGDNSTYLAIDCSPTSTSNLEWLLKNILGGVYSYSDFEKIISSYKAEDVRIIYLPFIYGGFMSNNVGGLFFNLRGYHTSKDLLRAVAEGICFAHYYHIKNLQAVGTKGEIIRLTGGASQNAKWCQIFADVTGINVQTPKSYQTGTLGLCMMVCIGVGIYNNIKEAVENMFSLERIYYPDMNAHKIFQDKYDKFIQLITRIGQ